MANEQKGIAHIIENELFQNSRDEWERIGGKSFTTTPCSKGLIERLELFSKTGCFEIRVDSRLERGQCLSNPGLTYIWVHPDDYETTKKRLTEAFTKKVKRND